MQIIDIQTFYYQNNLYFAINFLESKLTELKIIFRLINA